MYKIKKGWEKSEFHFQKFRRVIILDDNIKQVDLEYLYKIGHPAIIMDKPKKEKKDGDA